MVKDASNIIKYIINGIICVVILAVVINLQSGKYIKNLAGVYVLRK